MACSKQSLICKVKSVSKRRRPVDAIALLPEELWVDILDRITPNIHDALSCYKTCLLWNNLLGINNTTWMFPLIVPSMFSYLPKNSILECRLVCKTWSRAISTFLEETQPVHNEINRGSISRIRSLEVDFHRTAGRNKQTIPETLSMFQHQFSEYSSAQNPFLSRSLHLTLRNWNQPTIDFFDQFGSQIWYLHLSVHGDRFYRVPLVGSLITTEHIFQIISRVPNLRKLRFSVSLNETHNLKTYLESNQLPALPHLKMLDVSYVTPALLRNAFESTYASQLTALHHSGCMTCDWPQFNQLTTLSVDFNHANLMRYMDNIANLGQSRITKLHINLLERYLDLPLVLRWTEHFSETLQNLSIQWTREREAHFPDGYLNLPQLQTLKLRYLHLSQWSSFEFLFGLSNLRRLKIHFTYECYQQILEMMGERESSMRTRVIDMHQFFDDLNKDPKTNLLYRSNVWSLVPKLEMIRFSYNHVQLNGPIVRRTYSREQMPYMSRSGKVNW